MIHLLDRMKTFIHYNVGLYPLLSDVMEHEICNTTSALLFWCGNGHCIHLSAACDGVEDCTDGTDETVEYARCTGKRHYQYFFAKLSVLYQLTESVSLTKNTPLSTMTHQCKLAYPSEWRLLKFKQL